MRQGSFRQIERPLGKIRFGLEAAIGKRTWQDGLNAAIEIKRKDSADRHRRETAGKDEALEGLRKKVSRLAVDYASSGWLHRIGDGAFTVQPGTPTWVGAVFGLQQKSKHLHPGGRTELELSGIAHFLPLGEDYPLFLFSPAGERLPAWFKGLAWFERVRYMSTSFLPNDLGIGEHRDGEPVVKVSSPERAMLEFLQALELSASEYEHANLIFEGLGTLRADLVQSLLEQCASVKLKRLYLHLAERHNQAWLKLLTLSKVSLGSGKQVLVAGGRLDTKYLITVPAMAEPASDAA